MIETHGFCFSYSHDGWTTTIQNEGYSSRREARKAAYLTALNAGWRHTPKREKWWQFWRPKHYPEGYAEALLEISPDRASENEQ